MIDFNSIVSVCNSLNALEAHYWETDFSTAYALRNAQNTIWLLWAALNDAKGNPTCKKMKEAIKNAEN